MLAESDVIAFAPSTDLARSRTFYGEVLGLAFVEQNVFACVFDANGTMLRVTAVGELTPAPYTILGWRVDDIAASVASLAARGVLFTRYDGMGQDDLGIWSTPGGDRIAWFTDPDGNTLSLSQFVGA
jgi:catechol 2,3-dioxygenase-like lactoylglutathione lyase family enzyme